LSSATSNGITIQNRRLILSYSKVLRPDRLIDFSQESGRAGRDGSKASSIVLLHAGWKPQVDEHLSADREAMQLYLTQ
jgi:superfamily II DNA helicase RecQ